MIPEKVIDARFLLLTVRLFACVLVLPLVQVNAESNQLLDNAPYQVVFDSASQSEYNCFRIPAIVKATDGTLLAFAEGPLSYD
jgi:sialidase-1